MTIETYYTEGEQIEGLKRRLDQAVQENARLSVVLGTARAAGREERREKARYRAALERIVGDHKSAMYAGAHLPKCDAAVAIARAALEGQEPR